MELIYLSLLIAVIVGFFMLVSRAGQIRDAVNSMESLLQQQLSRTGQIRDDVMSIEILLQQQRLEPLTRNQRETRPSSGGRDE